MLNLRRYLSRRLIYAGLAVVVLLAMLDPFARQSIFGPKIDGIPWCVWESEIRESAGGANQKGWLAKILEKVGLRRDGIIGLHLDAQVAVPVHLQMADDRDAKVRLVSLEKLLHWSKAEHEAIMPIFRRHLEDDDPNCRVIAARGLWYLSKDRATIAAVLPLIGDADSNVQRQVVFLLTDMAAVEPSLFEHLAPLCASPDISVRESAVYSMRNFGKRGVPILRKALQDPTYTVKSSAISTASALRQDGTELYPDLLAFQNDANPAARRSASHALYIMDPKRFAKPATWVD